MVTVDLLVDENVGLDDWFVGLVGKMEVKVECDGWY
jgi:hypothetical protein